MDLQIILGLFLTILPVFELRGGLPIIVEYAVRNGVSVWPYFIIVLILNVLIIFPIFLFLDFLHTGFMKFGFYRRVFGRFFLRAQKKAEKVQKRFDNLGYLALMLFVAVPLPGTGAWTGTIVAWMLGLKRLPSFIAIALGVILAGFIVLMLSLGLFNGFY
jgi:uncharacterized membrane protein